MKTTMTTLIASSLLLSALPSSALAADDAAQDAEPGVYLEADRTPAGARIAGEAATGLLTGAVVAPVAFLGTWVGLEILASGREESDHGALARFIVSGVTGYAAGNVAIPAGVALAGNLSGGRGSILASYAGGLAAGGTVTALALVIGFGMEPGQDDDAFVMGSIVAIPLATTAGAILGYELTNDGPARSTTSAADSLYPILAVEPDGTGGIAGLGGRF